MELNESTIYKLDFLVESAVRNTVGLGALGLVAAKKTGALGALAKSGALAKAGAGIGKLATIAKAGGGATIVDPSGTRAEAAKHSAIASGLGTALVNAPLLATGNVPGAVAGTLVGAAAAKGGALGAALGGGRDTLTKSSLIPAGLVAAAAPLTSMALNAVNDDSESRYEVDPGISAGITGGVGAGMWALRNHGKKKEYI